MTLVWSGLAVGAIYALVAVGYNVVFISSATFNFANGALIMLGTYMIWWGTAILHLNPFVAVLLAGAVVGATAFVQERVAVRTWCPAGRLRSPPSASPSSSRVAWRSSGGGLPRTVHFFGGSNVVTVLGGRGVLSLQSGWEWPSWSRWGCTCCCAGPCSGWRSWWPRTGKRHRCAASACAPWPSPPSPSPGSWPASSPSSSAPLQPDCVGIDPSSSTVTTLLPPKKCTVLGNHPR